MKTTQESGQTLNSSILSYEDKKLKWIEVRSRSTHFLKRTRTQLRRLRGSSGSPGCVREGHSEHTGEESNAITRLKLTHNLQNNYDCASSKVPGGVGGGLSNSPPANIYTCPEYLTGWEGMKGCSVPKLHTVQEFSPLTRHNDH